MFVIGQKYGIANATLAVGEVWLGYLDRSAAFGWYAENIPVRPAD
jgi:hypothetical protein